MCCCARISVALVLGLGPLLSIAWSQDVEIAAKVIVTREQGAKLFSEPDGDAVDELPAMQIRFLHDDPNGAQSDDPAERKWLLVSRDGSTPDGWLRQEDVALWKTRSALEPKADANRVFKILDARSRDGNPLDDIEYAGDAPNNYKLLAPILTPRESEDDPYEIFVFGGNTASSPQGGTESIAFEDLKLEIVFVVDTTASMTPLIEGVKEVMKSIADGYSNAKDGNGRLIAERLRFGLVEYQDMTPGLTPANVRIPLCELRSFMKEIEGVVSADIGSVEWEEDVVAGLYSAMEHSGDGKVGWTTNSSKHIILCGDASCLPPSHPKSSTGKSIEDVLLLGHPNNIAEDSRRARAQYTFHSILALNIDGREDWDKARQDFQEVRANAGFENGEYAEMTSNDENSRRLVVEQFTASDGSITSAIEILMKTRGATTQLNPSSFARSIYRLKGNKPLEGVAFGKAHEYNESDQLVAVETWFLRYRELQDIKSSLFYISDKLKSFGSKRASTKDLVAALKVLFTAKGVGDENIESRKLLALSSELPLKNNVLNVTPEEIARMPDKEYSRWVGRLETSLKRSEDLLKRAENYGGSGLREWVRLGKAKSGEDELDYFVIFIPISELP